MVCWSDCCARPRTISEEPQLRRRLHHADAIQFAGIGHHHIVSGAGLITLRRRRHHLRCQPGHHHRRLADRRPGHEGEDFRLCDADAGFGIILIFQKSKSMNGIGYILAGLGFLFLGIHHEGGFEAFRDTIDLTKFAVDGYSGVLLFTLIGVFATVIMQSSHATLVIIITALAAGQITYENGLGLAIGANIGTTITAILGALSSNVMANVWQGRI